MFGRSRRPAPRARTIVERDEEYLRLFERGLDLDGGKEAGRRDRFWMLVQLFRSTFGLPGATVEAGCLFGLSSFLLCHTERLRDPSFTGRGHHVVDSFQGFDEPHERDFGPHSHSVIHALRQKSQRAEPGRGFRERTERTLAEFPDVAFHAGWIPEVLGGLPETPYRFVHVDVDLYEATLACLEYFHPRLVEGGVLVVDDYGIRKWPGCKAATDAFAEKHRVPVVPLPAGNAFLIKRS